MLAIAAATLLTSAYTVAGEAPPPAAEGEGATAATVHCQGINECKGQGACAGANNACGGQNECKGQGFVEITAEECDAKRRYNFRLKDITRPDNLVL